MALDKNLEVHSVYTDFTKAFDSVSHPILLTKLRTFGLSPTMIKWFASYIQNRELSVRFNGKTAESFTQTIGVPQGSVLGPLLFNLFINDLTYQLKCDHLLFADDLKIFSTINHPTDTVRLQGDIDTLKTWCSRNQLKLNVQKCFFIAFSNRVVPLETSYKIGGDVLSKVHKIEDLGVAMDSKLRFDAHIEKSVNKAYRMLGLVMRTTKNFTDYACINLIYNALVRSILEYNTSIWAPFYSTYAHRVERVQKLFTRQIFFKNGLQPTDYGTRLRALRMNSLQKRREYFDVLLLHKVGNFPNLKRGISSRNDQYGNRHRFLFNPPTSRTNYGLHRCPIHRAQLLFNRKYNQLDIMGPNTECMKRTLKNILNNEFVD